MGKRGEGRGAEGRGEEGRRGRGVVRGVREGRTSIRSRRPCNLRSFSIRSLALSCMAKSRRACF